MKHATRITIVTLAAALALASCMTVKSSRVSAVIKTDSTVVIKADSVKVIKETATVTTEIIKDGNKVTEITFNQDPADSLAPGAIITTGGNLIITRPLKIKVTESDHTNLTQVSKKTLNDSAAKHYEKIKNLKKSVVIKEQIKSKRGIVGEVIIYCIIFILLLCIGYYVYKKYL